MKSGWAQLAGYAVLATLIALVLWFVTGADKPWWTYATTSISVTGGLAGGLALRRWRTRRRAPPPIEDTFS